MRPRVNPLLPARTRTNTIKWPRDPSAHNINTPPPLPPHLLPYSPCASAAAPVPSASCQPRWTLSFISADAARQLTRHNFTPTAPPLGAQYACVRACARACHNTSCGVSKCVFAIANLPCVFTRKCSRIQLNRFKTQ